MAADDRPVLGSKPRSNVYTVLVLITTAAFIAALTLLIMEIEDVNNFRYQLFGSETYETIGGGK